MTPTLVLVSHKLCPYVQRAAIVLREKGVAFERRDVDLANKPAWFLEVSPLAKTPVLLVDGAAIFESAVICEYLDETLGPRLHPDEAIGRARERAWMEFGSALLTAIGNFYNAQDGAGLAARAAELRQRFSRLEKALGEGPWFAGTRFGMVDAVFAPVFRYFDVFDSIADFGIFDGLRKTSAWRAALAQRPSVIAAVGADYAQQLRDFLQARKSALADLEQGPLPARER